MGYQGKKQQEVKPGTKYSSRSKILLLCSSVYLQNSCSRMKMVERQDMWSRNENQNHNFRGGTVQGNVCGRGQLMWFGGQSILRDCLINICFLHWKLICMMIGLMSAFPQYVILTAYHRAQKQQDLPKYSFNESHNLGVLLESNRQRSGMLINISQCIYKSVKDFQSTV